MQLSLFKNKISAKTDSSFLGLYKMPARSDLGKYAKWLEIYKSTPPAEDSVGLSRAA